MKQVARSLALFLAATTVCTAAHSRKATPAKAKRPVVTQLVRMNAKAHKLSAPISFAFVPGEVLADGKQRARVSVTPLVDVDQVEIKIETRDGLELARGPHQWQVGARKNTAIQQDLLLTTSGKGERGLMIIATLHFPDGTTMSGFAAYTLNPAGRPTDTPLPGTREIIIDGEKLQVTPLPSTPAEAH
jgi:hypothetical protein